MMLVNFAHPLTAAQLAAVERLSGTGVERVVDVPTHFDPAAPYAEQVDRLLEGSGVDSHTWQTAPLLVNLPSYNVIAALLLAALHGRCGYFPTVLRLRPVEGRTPPEFEVAELVNLQAHRDRSRGRR